MIWDNHLTRNRAPGALVGLRLAWPDEDLAMTCGTAISLDSRALERLLLGTPPQRGPVLPSLPRAEDGPALDRLLAEPAARLRLAALASAPGFAAKVYPHRHRSRPDGPAAAPAGLRRGPAPDAAARTASAAAPAGDRARACLARDGAADRGDAGTLIATSCPAGLARGNWRQWGRAPGPARLASRGPDLSDQVETVDTVPPAPKLLAFALQHVLVMYAGAVAVPLIIGRAAKLPPDQVALLVNADLFACGIATLIQSLGIGPFGIRLPVMMGVTFAAVGPMVAMATNPDLGLLGIFGSVIAAGMVTMLIAPFVSRLLPLFPPVVTGTIILMIGISLMRVGVNWAAGAPAPTMPGYGDPLHLGMAGGVLVLILLVPNMPAASWPNVCRPRRHRRRLRGRLGHRPDGLRQGGGGALVRRWSCPSPSGCRNSTSSPSSP